MKALLHALGVKLPARMAELSKHQLAALEDFKEWGAGLLHEMNRAFNPNTINSLIASGHLQIIEADFGHCVALGPAGYRHFEYKFQWHVPTESAIIDDLAMRVVIAVMEARGYGDASRGRRAGTTKSKSKKTVARMVSPIGIPTYLLVKYGFPSAQSVKKTVEALLEDGIEDEAEVYIFREKGNMIKAAATRSHHRVVVENPPWANEDWA